MTRRLLTLALLAGLLGAVMVPPGAQALGLRGPATCTQRWESWAAVGTTGAPTAREAHTMVWTGGEMLVWGGDTGSGVTDTGGLWFLAFPCRTCLPLVLRG